MVHHSAEKKGHSGLKGWETQPSFTADLIFLAVVAVLNGKSLWLHILFRCSEMINKAEDLSGLNTPRDLKEDYCMFGEGLSYPVV